MDKVYICTDGEYSDYHICGVFDDKELAEKLAAKVGANVETWTLNPLELELREDYGAWFVRMAKNGDTVQCYPTKYEEVLDYGEAVRFDGNNNSWLYCFAKSEEHAVKIANEKRVRLIANNEWAEKPKPRERYAHPPIVADIEIVEAHIPNDLG